MKRHGMLNSHISKILTDLGHTDYIVIADAGRDVVQGKKVAKKIPAPLKLVTKS